ncbi:MAG: hypothetical protein NVSMB46_02370 [Candidatus Saccharimonadales bacterium]
MYQGAFISELSALSEPFSFLFRGADILSGVIWIAASYLIIKKYRTFQSVLLVAVMLITGIGNIVDAMLPLDCSETLSLACRNKHIFTNVHNIHLYESCIIIVLFVMITLILFMYLAFLKLFNKLFWVTLLLLLTCLWWLVDTLVRYGNHSMGYGYVQRIFEFVFIIWFVYFWYYALYLPHHEAIFASN